MGIAQDVLFTIMVNDANKNTVQVDEDGNLKYDKEDMWLEVLMGKVINLLDSQNDTTNNSVWIALKRI